MKYTYTFMSCDCCGKEFSQEYYQGGYIDHVVNFVGNMDCHKARNSIEDMAENILFDGNEIRETCYIEDFLKCFKTWDCFDDEFKGKVEKIVEVMLEKLKTAKAEANHIKKTTNPLVLAIVKGKDLDDAYWELFDAVMKGAK